MSKFLGGSCLLLETSAFFDIETPETPKETVIIVQNKKKTSLSRHPIHPASCAGAKAKVVWLLLLELLVVLELLEELLVVVELVVSVQEVVLKLLLLVVLLVLDLSVMKKGGWASWKNTAGNKVSQLYV